MENKTRIALCLSGEPRSSMFCFPYIYESLINLGPKYEVDVYIHSWKNFRALPLYNPKNYLIDWISEEKYYEEVIFELINNQHLNSSNVNQELKYIIENTRNVGPLKNTLLMCLSMQQCFNLIKKPYDIYIRGRFDYYFPNKFNLYPLIKNIKSKKRDIILPEIEVYNADHTKHLYSLFDDKFAICNLEGAKYYFNIYDSIFKILPKETLLNPHILLKEYLNKSNLNIDLININTIDLVRSTRIITHQNTLYLDN
jgi:hypothetical protein